MRALNDDDVRVMLSTLCSVNGSDEPQLSHSPLTILETERADEIRADREADDKKKTRDDRLMLYNSKLSLIYFYLNCFLQVAQ